MNTEVLVYDLISFEWSTEYDFSKEPPLRMVRDDSTVFEKKEEEIKKKEEDPKRIKGLVPDPLSQKNIQLSIIMVSATPRSSYFILIAEGKISLG